MRILLTLIFTLIPISASCLANDYLEANTVITTMHELQGHCGEYNLDEALDTCRECWRIFKEDGDITCSLCYGYLINDVENCTPCILEKYIATGMSSDFEIPNYGNILIIQSKQGNYPCLEYLINENADVNAIDATGSSALFYCSMEGFSDCTDLLVKSGANVNLQNHKGSTALMFAASYGHPESVKILLNYNASIHSTTYSGYTAMSYAVINSRWECINILYSEGDQCCSVFNVWLLVRSTYYNIPKCCSAYNRFDIPHIFPFLGLSAIVLFHIAKYWPTRGLDNKSLPSTTRKNTREKIHPADNRGGVLDIRKDRFGFIGEGGGSVSPYFAVPLKTDVTVIKTPKDNVPAKASLLEVHSVSDCSINERFKQKIRKCMNQKCDNQEIVQNLCSVSEEFSGCEALLSSLNKNEMSRLNAILDKAGVNRSNCESRNLLFFKGIFCKLKKEAGFKP